MLSSITQLNAALRGRYHVEKIVGEGGMASVYLAADLRHERKVALKVLKPELAAVVGAERFLAEIRTTANLQHPHVLPLFDSGEAGGFLFYVMPFADGESLRERLDREHQLPVEEAVQIARNVAEALHYAHGQGVVHRDIKPANILLQAGKPVVSDFGIALALGAAGGARLTETGVSLGTPHYMAPEQATGDGNLGTATDVYSLGCVLYEMLVGEPPYTGSTPQAILGRIITGEIPSANAERKSVPPHVDAAIRRALEKIPADRFGSIREMATALTDASFRHGPGSLAAGGGRSKRWRLASVGLGFAAVVFATLWAVGGPAAGGDGPLSFYPLRFPPAQEMAATNGMAFSSDGHRLVYVGPGGTLWALDRDRLPATAIPETDGASWPVLSPGGEAVAFVSGGADLRVVPLDGGPSRTLVSAGVFPTGLAWSDNGFVYFTARSQNSSADLGIHRIPADGSAPPEAITERQGDEVVHRVADVLPGGRRLLGEVGSEAFLVDLESRERDFLTEGRSPRYVSGHLVFVSADSTMMAVRFDPESAEMTGTPVPVVPDVLPGTGTLATTASGLRLAYLSSTGQATSEVVLVDRDGTETSLDPPWLGVSSPRVSPDGNRLLAHTSGQIQMRESETGVVTQLTFRDAGNMRGEWFPEGDAIAFIAGPLGAGGGFSAGPHDLFMRALDLDRDRELLFDHPDRTISQAVIGAEHIVIRLGGAEPGTHDIWAVSRADSTLTPVAIRDGVDERAPSLSPDGRFVAYVSDETGRDEVWVAPLLGGGSPVQVSTGGGIQPRWNPQGDEIFYQSGANQLVAVTVRTEPTFELLSGESELFGYASADINHAAYDVTDDGRVFVITRPRARSDVVIVDNFFELLRRVAPGE